MSKDLKEVLSVINKQEQEALGVLIQVAEIATKECTIFELDEAIVIGNAKNVLKVLIK